jgi:NAD-dependent dihydropyrimidine dehydrogenase PreA subunit
VIAINLECCDGCGACVEACPDGALYLVDGKAMVDKGLCRECETCIAVCPREAIALLSQRSFTQAKPSDVLAPCPEPEVIRVRTQSVPVSWRRRVLPLLGATAAWAARELGPVMAEYLIDRLERRVARQPRGTAKSGSDASKRHKGGGGRHRQRRRQRRSGSG